MITTKIRIPKGTEITPISTESRAVFKLNPIQCFKLKRDIEVYCLDVPQELESYCSIPALCAFVPYWAKRYRGFIVALNKISLCI